jgi:hypothetical protein
MSDHHIPAHFLLQILLNIEIWRIVHGIWLGSKGPWFWYQVAQSMYNAALAPEWQAIAWNIIKIKYFIIFQYFISSRGCHDMDQIIHGIWNQKLLPWKNKIAFFVMNSTHLWMCRVHANILTLVMMSTTISLNTSRYSNSLMIWAISLLKRSLLNCLKTNPNNVESLLRLYNSVSV